MDQRSPSFEATLLYKTAPSVTLDDIASRLLPEIDRIGERVLNVEKIDSLYALFFCQSLKILVSVGTETLPLDGFREAMDNTSDHSALKIDDDLLQISGHITVMVVGNESGDVALSSHRLETLEKLTRAVVAVLQGCTSPQFVFWAPGEALYPARDFVSVPVASHDRAASNSTKKKSKPQRHSFYKRPNSTEIFNKVDERLNDVEPSAVPAEPQNNSFIIGLAMGCVDFLRKDRHISH